MRRRLAAGALVLLFAPAARAQTYTGYAAADSAASAQAAAARSYAARRAGDLARARDEAARAAAAWPAQPAYALSWAVSAARVADTASVLRALGQYSALGLGRDTDGDSIFLPYLRTPAFAATVADLRRNAEPRVNSRIRATLPDSTFWPEGLDRDPRTGHFYVTSVRHGAVTSLAPDGTWRELWARGAGPRGAVLAARVDTARNALWVTLSGVPQMEGYQPSDSSLGALLRVRLADGVVERRWNLPVVRGGHALGDALVSVTGDVFLTDSNEPVLYRLRAGADTLEAIRHPLFRSLQGVTQGAEDGVLYVADYSHGLLRVELGTGAVTRLDDAPNSTSIGCDGIAFDDGAIIAVQNGVAPARVMRFVLDATGRRLVRAELLDRNSVAADEPTSVIVVGRDAVYVADSQWEKYDRTGRRVPNTSLRAPVLLAVPLSAAR